MRPTPIFLIGLFPMLFLLAFQQGMGQDTGPTPAEWEGWAGTELRVKLNKRFRFETEHQLRMENNFSQKKIHFHEFSLRWRLSKYFYLKPTYRMVRTPVLNEDRHRLSLDLYARYKKKKLPVSFSYRLRLQHEWLMKKPIAEGGLRNRLAIQYEVNKWLDTQLSYELFSHLGLESLAFRQQRLMLRANWQVSKGVEVQTFYGFEKQMNRKTNDLTHIVGIGSVFSIEPKKKKKK